MRRGLAVTAVASVLCGVAAAASQAAAPPPQPQPRPAAAQAAAAAAAAHLNSPSSQVAIPKRTIKWETCDGGKGYQCADVSVPVDYRKPTGKQMKVYVKRWRPAKPQGVIFTNPGGPGNPGSGRVESFVEELGKDVTSKFEVVGVDGRGTGYSGIFACEGPEIKVPDPAEPFPITEDGAKKRIAYENALRELCRKGGTSPRDTMTTADTARDMDVIRQAMGYAKLNYVGVSYGTFLGAVYGQLFPSRVHAMMLDGVTDVVGWSDATRPNTTVSERIFSGESSWLTMKHLLEQCAKAGKKCAGGPNIAAEFDAVMAKLAQGPATVAGEKVSYAELLTAITHDLYDVDNAPRMMDELHKVAVGLGVAKGAQPAKGSLKGLKERGNAEPKGLGTITEKLPMEGIICADTVNPKDPMVWWTSAERDRAATHGFSQPWSWRTSLCAGWPGAQDTAYRGPFTTKLGIGALIVNNMYDPATGLRSAQNLAKLSPGSRLVPVDHVGHLVHNASKCFTAIRTAYLLKGTLPPAGTTCKADKPIFP